MIGFSFRNCSWERCSLLNSAIALRTTIAMMVADCWISLGSVGSEAEDMRGSLFCSLAWLGKNGQRNRRQVAVRLQYIAGLDFRHVMGRRTSLRVLCNQYGVDL